MSTDARVVGSEVYFIPVRARVPLKFGPETLTEVVCARARVMVIDSKGGKAHGWGETPLSVQWVWPGSCAYRDRRTALERFCVLLGKKWAEFDSSGHALEIGHDFQTCVLRDLLDEFNKRENTCQEPMPWLAALVCCSVFDQAVHDAYGRLVGLPI
ncbi:MAG: hypothetical protein N3G20_01190, partial [Verrucomicrobiae bacterium]|nr:hypothetical protein [Verrucomicrobiae bacterium]